MNDQSLHARIMDNRRRAITDILGELGKLDFTPGEAVVVELGRVRCVIGFCKDGNGRFIYSGIVEAGSQLSASRITVRLMNASDEVLWSGQTNSRGAFYFTLPANQARYAIAFGHATEINEEYALARQLNDERLDELRKWLRKYLAASFAIRLSGIEIQPVFKLHEIRAIADTVLTWLWTVPEFRNMETFGLFLAVAESIRSFVVDRARPLAVSEIVKSDLDTVRNQDTTLTVGGIGTDHETKNQTLDATANTSGEVPSSFVLECEKKWKGLLDQDRTVYCVYHLSHFAGLNVEEIAQVCDIRPETVNNALELAYVHLEDNKSEEVKS
jgi:DNA-directed RNA polymerase specialized sigma24 family protein